MSKAHAKARDNSAEGTATAATTPAADTGTAPVVLPAPTATSVARPPDEHHGQGGLYTMKNGRRVLVERTQSETTKEPQ